MHESHRQQAHYVLKALLSTCYAREVSIASTAIGCQQTVIPQISEERSLAGLCGNPKCGSELQSKQPSGHYKIDGRVVWVVQDEQQLTCR